MGYKNQQLMKNSFKNYKIIKKTEAFVIIHYPKQYIHDWHTINEGIDKLFNQINSVVRKLFITKSAYNE